MEKNTVPNPGKVGWLIEDHLVVVWLNILSDIPPTVYIQQYLSCQLLDNWVNTALLLVFHSGRIGLETSWALLTIAAWLRVIPSSARLKLYLKVFSQANPNLRSCLIDWLRCSLQGQYCLQFLWTLYKQSLTHYCRRSLLNTGSPNRSVNTLSMNLPKEAPSRWLPRSYYEALKPISSVWGSISWRRTNLINLITQSYICTMKRPITNLNR